MKRDRAAAGRVRGRDASPGKARAIVTVRCSACIRRVARLFPHAEGWLFLGDMWRADVQAWADATHMLLEPDGTRVMDEDPGTPRSAERRLKGADAVLPADPGEWPHAVQVGCSQHGGAERLLPAMADALATARRKGRPCEVRACPPAASAPGG